MGKVTFTLVIKWVHQGTKKSLDQNITIKKMTAVGSVHLNVMVADFHFVTLYFDSF